MGKLDGFLQYQRKANDKISPIERITNYNEFYKYQNTEERKKQAARCMNCGVPFCGSAIVLGGTLTGCPLHNLIPEWNNALYRGHYSVALSRLLHTNPFPEFTGRVCPALCEKACINGMNDEAVTIHDNELFIIEKGFKSGEMTPKPPQTRSDKKVAIVGSGPSGLAVAEKLNKRGHNITVFEREDRFGGLLMYGIPNMKLDKAIVERRINLMKDEGITFISGQDLGKNLDIATLETNFDAVVLCCGAKQARELNVEGREAQGIYFAVEYLKNSTQNLLDQSIKLISAKDKRVIIVGGGDTGNDCVGTAIRQGASSVVQLEIMPQPPMERLETNPWPQWPKVYTRDYGQEEAVVSFGKDPRQFETTVKSICTENGNIIGVTTSKVYFENGKLCEVPKSEEYIEADMLLIATGFVGYESYCVKDCIIPPKDNKKYSTNKEKVYACGDMKMGQSLVVRAIADGISCAKEVDMYLMQ